MTETAVSSDRTVAGAAVGRAPATEAEWIAAAIGAELTRLAQDLFGLEQTIGNWAHAAGLDSMAIRDLQAADLIGQTLQELAGFLDRYQAASAAGGADPLASGIADIRLGDLRARLQSATGAAQAVGAASAPADVELF